MAKRSQSVIVWLVNLWFPLKKEKNKQLSHTHIYARVEWKKERNLQEEERKRLRRGTNDWLLVTKNRLKMNLKIHPLESMIFEFFFNFFFLLLLLSYLMPYLYDMFP